MKLFYGDLLLGEITTNNISTISDAMNFLDIDMDEIAKEKGWDNWDYDELRIEI